MRGRSRELLSISLHHYPFPKLPSTFTFSTSSSPSNHITSPPSVKQENTPPPQSSPKSRDTILLEKFKQRKLKGSSNDTPLHASATSNAIIPQKNEAEMVVSGFKELGLDEVLVQVLEEIGDFVPSELQCVAIPTILEGKCVLLSSPSQPENTLAFLLPLIQTMLALNNGQLPCMTNLPLSVPNHTCRTQRKENKQTNVTLKRANRISSNSHRLSQQSLEVVADPPFPREFNVDEYYDDVVLYAQPQTYYSNVMELTHWYN